jgi:hypothetical protein
MHSSAASVAKLSAALTRALAKMENPTKSKVVSTGKFSYSYAPLEDIVTSARKVLSEYELSAVQEAVTDNQGRIGVTTRIIHNSGEWLEFGPFYIPAGSGPQEYGSSLTYARRYALSAALGIAAEQDDDASSVKTSRRGSAPTNASPPATPNVPAGTGPDATANTDEGTPSPSSPAGTNVQGKGGGSDTGKVAEAARPGALTGSDGGTQVLDDAPTLAEQTHKFRGDDPNGACVVCGYAMEAHSPKAVSK